MADGFFWYELMTPDRDAARDFYTGVVGWTAAAQSAPDASGGQYVVLSAGNRGIGGILRLNDEMEAGGARPGWVGYIHAGDVDARVELIVAAGGTKLMGPVEIQGAGYLAMVADPGGAAFYVMNPKPTPGMEPSPMPPAGTPGTIGWRELYSSLGDKGAFDFYSAQFGWETMHEMDMGAMGTYRIFGADGEQWGGMMRKPEAMPQSSWGFYVNVDGIDAAVERLTAAGGTVANGPHQVPTGSWIVQAIDPQGAHFALTAPTR